MRSISTPSDVIEALGGTAKVAAIFGVDMRVVSNWKSFDRLPAKTFVGFRDALARVGVAPPESLWAMAPAVMDCDIAPAQPEALPA